MRSSFTRNVTIGLLALGTLALSAAVYTAGGQTIHGYSIVINRPFRDCNLQRMSSDDFISFGAHQIHAKRLDLEAISIVGTGVVAYALHHTILRQHSAKVAAAVAGVGMGAGPHAYSQILTRRYPIDVTHDAAEISQRMAPYALAFGDDGSFSQRANAVLWAAALVALGACDAQY